MAGYKIFLFLAVLFAVSPVADPTAQTRRAKFGPVVSAYLTGLGEQLSELEYQITHKEISRIDYLKAKQRLVLLRRMVESQALKSREDAVPEYLILGDDELKTLGLTADLSAEALAPGVELENQWKLLAIDPPVSPNRYRFFIFERIRPKEVRAGADALRDRKRGRELDLAAIETIVVNERPPVATPPPQAAGPAVKNAPSAQVQPRIQLPRIINIQLPEYTSKAREKNVEGELVIRALFQHDGKIRDLKVEKGLGHGLDQRAIDTVKKIGFSPAQVDRQEVDAWVEVVFNFTLREVLVYVRASAADVTPKGAN